MRSIVLRTRDGHVDVRRRGDLTRDDHQTGGDQGLAGHVTLRIVLQHRVEHGVGDLVGDLVGMTLADRFRREQEITVLHGILQSYVHRRPSRAG